MDDAKIVELYWQRAESAITETAAKFGAYLHAVAFNILGSAQDAEECVNDTYLGAWNSMPDKRPMRLSPYLGRIARNAAIDRAEAAARLKRGGGESSRSPLRSLRRRRGNPAQIAPWSSASSAAQ